MLLPDSSKPSPPETFRTTRVPTLSLSQGSLSRHSRSSHPGQKAAQSLAYRRLQPAEGPRGALNALSAQRARVSVTRARVRAETIPARHLRTAAPRIGLVLFQSASETSPSRA